MVEKFGITDKGENVDKITLFDEEGNSVSILNYGATIQSIVIDNTDVVLGYDSLEEYETNSGYLGATIGRCANRIKNASFSISGKTYNLSINRQNLHIHGGFVGFDKKIWSYNEIDSGVTMSLFSPDGDEGYPGNLKTDVTFIFTHRCLSIKYDAVADKKTLINLTNHSYFNLDGYGTILDHTLQIN